MARSPRPVRPIFVAGQRPCLASFLTCQRFLHPLPEWYAYVFDAIPLALAMLLYAWFWPARYLSSSGSSARGEHKLVPLTQTRSSTWDHV
jgi:hypothetical protein